LRFSFVLYSLPKIIGFLSQKERIFIAIVP